MRARGLANGVCGSDFAGDPALLVEVHRSSADVELMARDCPTTLATASERVSLIIMLNEAGTGLIGSTDQGLSHFMPSSGPTS